MWISAVILIFAFVGCQAAANLAGDNVFQICGYGSSVSGVSSIYDGMDRLWDFECQPFLNEMNSCIWSVGFKAFEQEVHFNCKANYVMTGVVSSYNSDEKDREWYFLCCSIDKLVTYDCRESSKLNYFKEDFKWSVPGSNYLTGVRTYGSTTEDDHRWSFSYCRAAMLDSASTSSQILNINSPISTQLSEGDVVVSRSRSATNCLDCKWSKSNGLVQVPYAVSDSFSDADKEAILSAMKGIHLTTCVRFVPVNGHDDYVSIQSKEGCWSYVGRTGGIQELSLGSGCLGASTVQHELIHSLGFWHEQSRSDRDIYVKIHWDNIKESQLHNFQQKDTMNLNVAYDFTSLMHYGPTDFSKNGENTITPQVDSAQIGQAVGMSERDVLKINKLYGCSDYLHRNGLWDSELKESLNKQCPSGQAVASITSFYDTSEKDRKWGVTCKAFVETKACFWSSYVNEYWGFMDFKCSENKVITGVHSKYHGVYNDRMWKFMCCDKANEVPLFNCKDEPVISYWGEYFNWKVASNNFLTGVKSTFDSNRRDRRWSFTYCQRKQL